MTENNNQTTTPAEEKKDSLALFQEDLAGLLDLREEFLIMELNESLIDLIIEDEKFKRDLESALYNNQEKLTYKTFKLNGKPERPTVASWLKYFIRKNGSGIFDNLSLADFINNSENAKILNSEEKERLTRLLKLYRNLKFFFTIFSNRPPEEWIIVPLTQVKEEKVKARTVKPVKSREEEMAEGLKIMAAQYQPGSLERKAIEEEIKKLEVRSKK